MEYFSVTARVFYDAYPQIIADRKATGCFTNELTESTNRCPA